MQRPVWDTSPKARALHVRPLERDSSDDFPLPEIAIGAGRPAKAWFAVFTYPRHEKKVAAQSDSRGLESFLPVYTVKRRWKNRQTVTLQLPLFPNYLFAHLDSRERTTILSLPGVAGIVGGPGNSVPATYVEALRTGVRLGRIQPHPEPVIGERVRICSGPLAGIEGVLTKLRSEFRVTVSIELIQQSVSISVSRDEIVPLAATAVRKTIA